MDTVVYIYTGERYAIICLAYTFMYTHITYSDWCFTLWQFFCS